MLVLNAGRRAFNEAKYPIAADRFREFLKVTPAHKEASAARYGLGLALLESGDVKGALETLQQVAGTDSPDKPLAIYHLGAVQRTAGTQALAQIAAKPAEAEALRTAALQSFGEAVKAFTTAGDLLAARVKKPLAGDVSDLPPDAEWLVRARCDQAEMLIRLGKAKEAADVSWALLADPGWSRSAIRPLASYYLGHASFLLKDYAGAGRALSELWPFGQEFGGHARYLLARTHHLSGELAEAGAQYKAVLTGFEEEKKTAAEKLKNPAALKAEQRAALEALVNQPPPEHLARTVFYSAVLAFDEGRVAEAAEQFAAFAQKNPKSPLIAEAQFRIGACNVQLKKFPEAVAALDPLKEHPQLADQVLMWLARAKLAAADPAKPAEYEAAANAALAGLRSAAQRSQELAKTDPDAKSRRGTVLMELADAAVLAKQFKEAVTNYELVVTEKLERAEEAMQRQVTALHLGGQYPEADALARKFEETFPKSTLLPAVLFRSAENAYLSALKLPDAAQQKQALIEVVKRYQRVVRRFPEFAYINMARQGLATAHYRAGNYAEAALAFGAIAEPDRIGELAAVPYLMADCLVRTLPAEADDALQAARLIEQAERAAKLLEGFVAAHEKSPQVPDALLKLGHCYQRVGSLLAAPAERTKVLTSARDAFDRALKLGNAEPIASVAAFERAKCLASLGDVAGASGALAPFQNPPLNATPNAPLALMRLSMLLRAQGKAAEAVPVMVACRTQHEAKLAADPARSAWAAALQYEHAVAVKESGKLAEARPLFDAIAKQFAARPEGMNALWRLGQCQREEAATQFATARTASKKPGATPEEIAAATKALEASSDALQDLAEKFSIQAEQVDHPEARGRLFYEAAWSFRALADHGVETAKPRVVESYEKAIAAGKRTAVATQAQCELAELHLANRNGDSAIELLTSALETDPASELAERIRLALAAAHLARKEPKIAHAFVQPMLAAPAPPAPGAPVPPVAPPTATAAEARLIAGEALTQQELWPKAIEQLVPFRDDEKLRNFAGVSDRALLRLGNAYAHGAQWDLSRQTMEALVQRYPQSPWIDEARYGIGWVWQNQKNFDQAIAAFTEVTKRTASEVAAKAQLQIGRCRIEQQRYEEAANALLAVAFTYNYPDWTAPARCEAGRAQFEGKKPVEAARQWQQVVTDFPNSPWADVARKSLVQIK